MSYRLQFCRGYSEIIWNVAAVYVYDKVSGGITLVALSEMRECATLVTSRLPGLAIFKLFPSTRPAPRLSAQPTPNGSTRRPHTGSLYFAQFFHQLKYWPRYEKHVRLKSRLNVFENTQETIRRSCTKKMRGGEKRNGKYRLILCSP